MKITIRLAAVIMIALAILSFPAQAQINVGSQATQAATDAAVIRARTLLLSPGAEELLGLLAKSDVRAALSRDIHPAEPETHLHVPMTRVVDALAVFRQRIMDSLGDAKRIPPALTASWGALAWAAPAGGALIPIVTLFAFAVGGAFLEHIWRRTSADWLRWISARPMDGLRDRTVAFGQRVSYWLTLLVSFAVGSIGTYLLFDWPGAWGVVAIALLTGFLSVRLAAVLSRILLAPAAPRFRLLDVSDRAAPALQRLSVVVAISAAFTWQGSHTLAALSGDPLAAHAFCCIAGIVSIIMIYVFLPKHWHRQRLAHAGSIVWFAGMWSVATAGYEQAAWMLALAAALPAGLAVADQMTASLVRGPKGTAPSTGVWGAVVGRTFRAAAISAALLSLGLIWGVNPLFAYASPDVAVRSIAGPAQSILILIAVDLAWQCLTVLIDLRISVKWSADEAADEGDRMRRARLRTVIPVVRSLMLFGLCCIGATGVLASLGLEIAPLLAGAGIVGISVGFGAQALVRDIISGFFFLLDDAFRIGEVIDSGALKGEVISFSLRSVRLRDETGKLHTVPFGELKSLANHSRDWAGGDVFVHLRHDVDMVGFDIGFTEACAIFSTRPDIAPLIVASPTLLGIGAIGEVSVKMVIVLRTLPGHFVIVRAIFLRTLRDSLMSKGIQMGADPAVLKHHLSVSGSSQDMLPNG